MKKTFSTLFMAAGLLATTLFTSCSDDDNNNSGGGVTATKEYKLYNYSNPSGQVEAGSVVFSQLADSSASATVTLAAGYRQSGTTYTVSIITAGNTNAVYSLLTGLDGGVGSSTTSPVKRASDGIVEKYSKILSYTGYQVKVSAGSVTQAIGTIQ